MRRFFRRRANQREIEADVEAYLSEKTDALIAAGLSPEEARLRARREFGNVTLTKELSSDEWSWGVLEQVVGDIRYALRSMWRNPAFALTAILTLALGIGVNAAIFNLLHAVILRTLPVPHAEQLRLFKVVGPQNDLESIFSYPVLSEIQAATGDKAGVAAFSAMGPVNAIVRQGEAEQVSAQLVSGNFFSVLGVKAAAGHLLSPADDTVTGNYPAILSDGYWAKRFGSDPSVLGQAMTLNGTPVTIVGIAGKSFFGLSPGSRPDFWLPVSAQNDLRFKRNVWNSNGHYDKPFMEQREIRWLSLVMRIHDARMEPFALTAVNQVYGRDMQREAKGWKDDPAGARDLLRSRIQLDAGDKGLGALRRKFTEPLLVLMCAAGLVLLIAAVNLASLALARVISRRKEIAVRCSIGASRGRIISQFITEILILSVAGGAIAIPVAIGASGILIRWASGKTPLALEVGLEWPLLWFVGVASVTAGLVFGLLPALEAINFPLADAMKATASAVKGMRLPWGRTLIAVQVMFSFVLLTGAVLFVRTFLNYEGLELGFSPQHVVSVQIDPLGGHYTTEQLLPTYRRVLEAVSDVPGVQSASLAECGLALGCESISNIQIEGQALADKDLQSSHVSSSYFSTVGMRLISGRLFSEHDPAKKPLFAVINAAAAKAFFPGINPLGRHFGPGQNLTMYEIVGVVADARINDLHETAKPMAYYSLDQDPQYVRSLEVRAKGDPRTIERAVRSAIRESAPAMPVMEVRLLTDQVESNLLRERLVARLASAFAVLALALACLGVYGVLSYAITRRTSEIGIRLALGAEGSSVRWMVLREALWVIGIGLVLGVPVAVGVTRLVGGLLYGVSASDPTSMVAGGVAMLGIGFAAAFIPAWRASRVDPNVALRYE